MYKRIIAFAILIFLALLPLYVEGQTREKGKEIDVLFDLVDRIQLWQPNEKEWHRCQIVDWNLVGSPHPQLTVAIPPHGVFCPLRIYVRLTWKAETGPPKWWMGIDARPKRLCKLRPTIDGVQVKLVVYGKTK